jgi:hypothetical protein
MHFAGPDEKAVVGPARGVAHHHLFQACIPVLKQFELREVREAAVRNRPGDKYCRFIQVETGTGGGSDAIAAGLIYRKAALGEQRERIRDAEFDFVAQVGNLRGRLGSIHIGGRQAVSEPLEHVAILVQSRDDGMAIGALEIVLSREGRDRLSRLRSERKTNHRR